MAVRVTLLGRFGLTSPSEGPLALPPRKAQALIAILALAGGQPVPRERLTALLWSDRGEAQARGSLRQALSALRRAFDGIAPPPLVIDADHVALDPDAAEVDALRFVALARSAAAEDLEQAAALYRGDLLEGLQVRDPGFEDWLESERQRLRRLLSDALSRLLSLQEQAGRSGPAIVTAERWLAQDPLNEAAHRALMRLYAGTGERNRALGQYKLCRETLERELGIAPEPATEQLHEEIAGGRAAMEEAPAPGPAAAIEDAGGLPVPDKPSVAVLPFTNMSGDPEQEYFSDGITGDIITELTRFRSLFVIGNVSSFHYKAQSPKIQDVGRELGVAYVVEGSVRKAGNRVRITAQLVEAATGHHIWAERYDRELEDIFAVQDEVTGAIVSTLAGHLEEMDRQRVIDEKTEDLAAYDYLLLGDQCLRQLSMDGILRARQMFQRAIDLEPGSARAHTGLARSYLEELWSDWSTEPKAAAEQAFVLAKKAVALNELDGRARINLAVAYYLVKSNFELAEIQFDKALELNPNDADGYCLKGWCHALSGQGEQAIVCTDQALRLSPFDIYDCRMAQFAAFYAARRYEEAMTALGNIPDPGHEVNALLAACYAQLGRDAGARRAMTEFLSAAREEIADYPGEDRERWRHYWTRQFPFKDPADLDHLLDGLCKAGLPDAPAGAASAHPAKPTIAVLPFDNLSGDPEQAYFADGLTEDIITGLSRFRDVAVIARTSSFAFRGQSLAVAEIAEKLGVQYIVEGSVRRAGERVRITAQLIDAESGAHRWGQSYDREMADIFEVQDEVTRTIVATLAGRLGDAGVDRARRKPTVSLTALDYLLQGRDLVFRYSREDIAKARRLLEKAIALDPGYAEAHAWLAECHWADWSSGWTADAESGLERGAEIAAKALALDDSDPQVHMIAGWYCLFRHQYDEARYHFDKAAVLNPNQPDLAMLKSFHATFTGDHAGALANIQEAMRLDPFGRYGFPLGLAHYGLKQYEEAAAAFKTIRAKLPEVIAWRAACHAQMGQDDDARTEAARFVETSRTDMRDSGLPIPESWMDFLTARNPYQRPEDMTHFTEGLRKAGLE